MKRKEPVLVLTSTYPRWVGDTVPPFVHELSRRLSDNYDVHVLAPHAEGCAVFEKMDGVFIHRFRYGPPFVELLAYNGGMLSAIKGRKLLWLVVPFFLTAQLFYSLLLIHRYRIRTLHCHWIIPQGLVALVLRKIYRQRLGLLLTIHGGDLYALNSVLLFRRLKRRIVNAANHVTVVSTAMRHDLLERIPEVGGRVSVAPMGVDLDNTFTSSCEERKGILFAGRLVEKKGVTDLVSAFARLVHSGCSESLTIVGDGPLMPELEDQVVREGIRDRVDFVGAVRNADLPLFYQRAKLVVIPSVETSSGDKEGLGLVLVEAIGCGAPVVVSDLTAFDEVLTEGMSSVSRFAAGNVDELFEQMNMCLSNYVAFLEDTGTARTRVAVRFAWKTVACNYRRLLEDLGA